MCQFGSGGPDYESLATRTKAHVTGSQSAGVTQLLDPWVRDFWYMNPQILPLPWEHEAACLSRVLFKLSSLDQFGSGPSSLSKSLKPHFNFRKKKKAHVCLMDQARLFAGLLGVPR